MEKMGGIVVPLILLPPTLVNFKSLTFVHKVLQTSCDIVITFKDTNKKIRVYAIIKIRVSPKKLDGSP